MNYANFLLDPVKTVQFLSLFTYLNKLSDVLYSEKLLLEEHKGQTFPIVNAFYEYLNQTNNEIEIKRQLTQKLLEGSSLYGGNKNETLDMEYINATLNYIISSAVFQKDGNIYGYISKIVSKSKNLKLSVFKQTMYGNLFYLRHWNDDGSVSQLSQLSMQKIAESLLWPLFPEPTEDIKIITIKYMYAQAGKKLAQFAQLNLTNLSFSKFVILGITVETTVMQKKLPTSALSIFKLPALIFYTYKQREKFNQRTTQIMFKDKKFWNKALFMLFSHLNTTFETINQQAMEEDSLYQFHLAMSNFRNRTAIGKDFLRKECAYTNETELNAKVEDYKTYASGYYCQKYGKTLPNLDNMYKDQLPKIREKYRTLVVDFLQESFNEFPNLRNLINLTYTRVLRGQPQTYDSHCYMCSPKMPSYNRNIDFFVLKNQKDVIHFFALEYNESNVTVLLLDGNQTEFNDRVGLARRFKIRVSEFIKYFKETDENFNDFIKEVADVKAMEFKRKLYAYGYDKTSVEEFLDIVKVFIPFYSCVESASEAQEALTVLSCFMDVLGFVPFLGQLGKIGLRLTSVAANRLFISTGISVRAFTLRQAILSLLSMGLKKVAVHLQEVSIKVLLTKEMFKSLSVGLLRAVDPGFEFVWKFSWHGSIFIGLEFRNLYRNVLKRFPNLNLQKFQYRKVWQQFINKKIMTTDPSGMNSVPAGQVDGHDVFRYVFPGGSNPFGPKRIRLSNGNAELRKIKGFDTEMPVIVTRVGERGRLLYKQINLKTEKIFGLEMRLNKNNVLVNVKPPFRKHVYNIVKEGLGGRGAQLSERQRSIDNAAKLVASSNLGYTEKQARDRMKHYILATHDVSNAEEGLEDINIFNSEDAVDHDFGKLPDKHFAEEVDASGINPNVNNDEIFGTMLNSETNFNFVENINIDEFIRNHVIEEGHTINREEEFNKYLNPATSLDNLDLGTEPHFSGNNRNQDPHHLNLENDQNFDETMNNPSEDLVDSIIREIGNPSVPTFSDFANDWIMYRGIDKYDEYFVNNPTEMETLLFEDSLPSGLEEFENSNKVTRIISIFQQSNVVFNNLDIRNVRRAYIDNTAFSHINYEDYFLLYAWMRSGFIDAGGNQILTTLLEKALYRLGVRQLRNASTFKLSRKLFFAEIKVDGDFESIVLNMRGKTLQLDKLQLGTERLKDCRNHIKSKTLFKELDKSDSQMKLFIYKISLNRPVLRPNLSNLFKMDSKKFILLPNTKYIVEDIKVKKIWGYRAIHVLLRNVPLTNKEILIANAMKEIEIHNQAL